MKARTVEERFDRVEEFMALLGAAELSAAGEWEEQFISDLHANFQRYGAQTYLSDNQLEKLEQIASK